MAIASARSSSSRAAATCSRPGKGRSISAFSSRTRSRGSRRGYGTSACATTTSRCARTSTPPFRATGKSSCTTAKSISDGAGWATPSTSSTRSRSRAKAAARFRSVDHLHVVGRETLAQAIEQAIVERDPPFAAELDLAPRRSVLIVDDDRRPGGTAAERRQQLEQAIGRARSVACDLERARPLAARAGEVVQRFGDDAQRLDLSVVAGALHHLDLGDQQRVLAQHVPAGIEGLVEDGDLALILAVVEDDESHLAAPRGLRAQLRDDSGNANERRRWTQHAERLLHQPLQLRRVSMVRMPRQVEAEARLLLHQSLGLGPFARRNQRRAGRASVASVLAEQQYLRRGAVCVLGAIERRADRGQQARAPRLDAVERAGADQRLDRAPVDETLVDAAAEVEQIDERTLLAGGDDRFRRGPPGALDAAESVADATLVDRLETVARCVDVRRQHFEADRRRVDVELAHLVGIVHHQRKVRRHERRGMMRLEV